MLYGYVTRDRRVIRGSEVFNNSGIKYLFYNIFMCSLICVDHVIIIMVLFVPIWCLICVGIQTLGVSSTRYLPHNTEDVKMTHHVLSQLGSGA